MLRWGQALQLVAVAMLGLGVVVIHSAGLSIGSGSLTDPLTIFASRNLAYAGLAVVAMMFASHLDIRWILRHRSWTNPLWLLVPVTVALLALTFVPGFARTVNGASRWLYLGPRSLGLSFQPSELAKLTVVLAVAAWCAGRQGSMKRFFTGLLPPLMLVGVVCVLIVKEDLGTAVLIALVAVVLLVAGGARVWQLLLLAPFGVAGIYFAVIREPYRVARLTAFLDPWADPRGVGYHPIQSMLAIAMGGPTGRGLGNGIQKFGYLPEDTTDFIFAVICEEQGLAGALLVVTLLLMLVWIALVIARQCKDMLGRLIALGILLTIGLQAAMNLMVVTVMVPTKGIALPLISAGGTGWIITAFGLGLVASLDRAHELDPQYESPVRDLTHRPVLMRHPMRAAE